MVVVVEVVVEVVVVVVVVVVGSFAPGPGAFGSPFWNAQEPII